MALRTRFSVETTSSVFYQDFLGNFLGNHQDPLLITNDEVSFPDCDAADTHRLSIALELPSTNNVKRSVIATKNGKFQLQDIVNIAAAAIDHYATGSRNWAVKESLG